MENTSTTQAQAMRCHIEARKACGKSVTHYCKEHSISKANYYYWNKKLQLPKSKPSFVSVTIDEARSGSITVSFPNGVSIDFKNSVGVSVLKELACCI